MQVGMIAASNAGEQRPSMAEGLNSSGPYGAAVADQAAHAVEMESVSSALARRAWAVMPEAGRFAVWPGNLLHGVLPGSDAGNTEGSSLESGEGLSGTLARTTLIFAWWASDPRQAAAPAFHAGDEEHHPQKDGASADLQPCMSMPLLVFEQLAALTVPAEASWLAQLPLPARDEDPQPAHEQADSKQQPMLLPALEPAWAYVPDSPEGSAGATVPLTMASNGQPSKRQRVMQATLSHAPLPPLRFFLRHALDIAHTYVAT